MYSFRNDYSEGAHPKVLQALADTNLRQTVGYGMDPCCPSRGGYHPPPLRRAGCGGSLPGGRDAGEPRHHRRVSAVL